MLSFSVRLFGFSSRLPCWDLSARCFSFDGFSLRMISTRKLQRSNHAMERTRTRRGSTLALASLFPGKPRAPSVPLAHLVLVRPMKLYTEMQVFVASFLGSPVAGGILMAHNASAVGAKREARRYLFISAAATTAFLL